MRIGEATLGETDCGDPRLACDLAAGFYGYRKFDAVLWSCRVVCRPCFCRTDDIVVGLDRLVGDPYRAGISLRFAAGVRFRRLRVEVRDRKRCSLARYQCGQKCACGVHNCIAARARGFACDHVDRGCNGGIPADICRYDRGCREQRSQFG